MVAIRRETGVLPPPPLPSAVESPLADFRDSAVSQRLYGWQRRSRQNKTMATTVVVLFVGLALAAGLYALLRPGGGLAGTPMAGERTAGQSTLSAKQRSVLAWMKVNIADPNCEVTEWSPLLGKQYEAQARWQVARATAYRPDGPVWHTPISPFLYVKIRHQTPLGGYGITTLFVDFHKGTNELANAVGVGSAWPNDIWENPPWPSQSSGEHSRDPYPQFLKDVSDGKLAPSRPVPKSGRTNGVFP